MIPSYIPHIAKNQKKYVLDCLDSNWISSRGKYIDLFEERLAEYFGVPYAITVCNGTVSLQLILAALGIKAGNEIFVPSITYAATVSAICWSGAIPILVDSDENLQIKIDEQDIIRYPKAVAIIVPQLYGDSPDMIRIVDLCHKHGLLLIEDSAEAFGCEFNGKKLGTFGVASSFSLFANKIITTGEGGFILTESRMLADNMRLLKSQNHLGMYIHRGPGFNFRMTNIQAAIGLAQFEEIDFIIKNKQHIADRYRAELKLQSIHPKCYSTEWNPVFFMPDQYEYKTWNEQLLKDGIETRPCFIPIHKMSEYSGCNWKYKQCSLSNNIWSKCFNLPCYPDLTEQDQTFIIDTINEKYI